MKKTSGNKFVPSKKKRAILDPTDRILNDLIGGFYEKINIFYYVYTIEPLFARQ